MSSAPNDVSDQGALAEIREFVTNTKAAVKAIEAHLMGDPVPLLLRTWDYDDRLDTDILKMGPYIGDGAADEILRYLKGVLDVGDEEDRDFATVTPSWDTYARDKIFCHMRLMGMGKTRLHNELCSPDSEVGSSVAAAMAELQQPVKFIRFTYAEADAIPYSLQGPINATTFWKQLLHFHGLSAREAAKVDNEDDAVRYIREKLGMQEGTTLVVCVDELMKMPGTWRKKPALLRCDEDHLRSLGDLIRDLLMMQTDNIRTFKATSPLVFLFSGFSNELLDAAQASSRRQSIEASLPRLSEKELEDLLFAVHPELEQIRGHPIFVLLFKLCAPTPKYVLEGLPKALRKKRWTTPCSLNRILSAEVSEILQIIRGCSQSGQYSEEDSQLVGGAARSMLQGKDLDNTQKKCLATRGWLYTREDKHLLHPMILREWSEARTGGDSIPLRNALSDLFGNDDQTGTITATFATEVFMYFEQARRLSIPDGTTTTLARHFPGGNFHKLRDFEDMCLYDELTVPKGSIQYLRSFQDVQRCQAAVDAGDIAYAQKARRGVRCVLPFHKGGTVWCGAVQIQFTWFSKYDELEAENDVGEKEFANSLKELDKDKYKCFGILFPAEQGNASEFEHVCSLNRDTLMQLMEPRVGPLRMLYDDLSTSPIE